jgi:hypothetical protein
VARAGRQRVRTDRACIKRGAHQQEEPEQRVEEARVDDEDQEHEEEQRAAPVRAKLDVR